MTALTQAKPFGTLAEVVTRVNNRKYSADALYQYCADLEAENARLASRITYLEGLNQRDESAADQRFSRYEQRISDLSNEVQHLKAQIRQSSAGPSANPEQLISVKALAAKTHISERTLYRRYAANLITRPDGSQGWVVIGGGDKQDHIMIYADAIVKSPNGKKKGCK